MSIETPDDIEFDSFIMHLKGAVLDVAQFFDYWEHHSNCLQSRQETERVHPYDKKDTSLGLSTEFDEFFRYLNGPILSLYREKYDGYGHVVAYKGRMQRTKPCEGFHQWHCERVTEESNRVLAWSLSLNDEYTGGETEFLHQSKRYKPMTGDLLVWPAGFTHIHRGNPPLDGEKYIATGWYEFMAGEIYGERR